ncbi:M61 family metallopeptidase [Herbaspirillum sp. WKF16]|uniref:M61 family metallopeptidase n=1 Tax=Herbaspirillum sp. WKF16 TaxID=3028312 RepID=UPI0023AA0190|nr:M61 family metallopeptidase [Herbaspirillum sp. WKF16]WDZ95437.1 M61 family metallopeptidase [Herbaspirillum sp. WKF16]
MANPIRYTISSSDPASHMYDVTVTVDKPAADGQVFSLPAWIPGSYMIREFGKNIVQLRGESGGRKVAVKKLDKHTWQAAPCGGALTLSYQVYAWDLSVRTAHLDQTHGFFNGTSVFLAAHGFEGAQHVVDIGRPQGEAFKRWRVATSLPELKARRYGFGSYAAKDYDELIDHPVEIGDFALASFKAHGAQHDVVITGRVPNLDMARLCDDLKKICEAQIAFFEPKKKRAPMQRYVFMTLAVGDGYGGLEHRASTALICSRADLPVKGKPEQTDGYRTYLGLCSHEYFHTWNVKRIKPAVFAPYDLRQENYTSLLWLFEGFTSYYDDLFLVRTGVIDTDNYLKLLAKTVTGVLRGSGRKKQSVAESSFDAWVKYYRQDENAANAIVSYYTKGSLVALGLDLTIRAQTRGRRSLDDVMRGLWERHGRDFYEGGAQGVPEDGILALMEELSGADLKRFYERFIRGTEDLPLGELLPAFGVSYDDALPRDAKPWLGARVSKDGGDAKLAVVHEGGPAMQAGLSAGDKLVAIDGLRVPASGADGLLARYRVNDTVRVHAFRRDELMEFTLKLKADVAPQVTLAALGKPAAMVRQRESWLKLKA